MIKSFKHKGLRKFFETGSVAGIQPKHAKRLRMQLAAIDTAQIIDDIDLPGFGLHSLSGRREGQWSMSISGNWREFLLLASRQEDPDTLFFRRRLVIEGDTELGLGVKNLIDSLDPDVLPVWLWRSLERMGRGVVERQPA